MRDIYFFLESVYKQADKIINDTIVVIKLIFKHHAINMTLQYPAM